MPRRVIELDKPWTRTVPFSLGVVGEGRILFTAGITARDSNGEVIGKGDMRAQMEQCFRNVGDVLRAAGTDFGNVLKWTMYTRTLMSSQRMLMFTSDISSTALRVPWSR